MRLRMAALIALKHDAQGFANGAASMLLREAWVIPFIKKNGPDIRFGVARMPRDKAWGNFNLLEILCVNKTSKMKRPTQPSSCVRSVETATTSRTSASTAARR